MCRSWGTDCSALPQGSTIDLQSLELNPARRLWRYFLRRTSFWNHTNFQSTKNPLRFQVGDLLLAWTCLPQFQQTPQIDMGQESKLQTLRQLTSRAQKSEHLNKVMDAFAFLSQVTSDHTSLSNNWMILMNLNMYHQLLGSMQSALERYFTAIPEIRQDPSAESLCSFCIWHIYM